MKLTDKAVVGLVCPEGRKDMLVFDDALPGFGVRVTVAGKRVFLFQRKVGAASRRIALGEFGQDLTTTQARRQAEKLRGQVLAGADPVAERRATRAATAAAEAAARAAAAKDAFTVDALIQAWTDNHLVQRSVAYRLRVPRELRAVLRSWLKAPASSLAHEDAVTVLDRVAVQNGPVAANRLRAEVRACWAWGVKRGSLSANPWADTPKPMRENSRDRVLEDRELVALWRAVEAEAEPWRGIVQLLVLTGQRRSEVAGLAWSEVDLAGGIWRLPAVRTKNGHAHEVPLASATLAILNGQRRGGSSFVFNPDRATPPSGFGRMKLRVDKRMQAIAAKDGWKLASWTLHDLRRTLATGLQKMGVRLEVTEAVLNHTSGSRAGIVAVYQRHKFQVEKSAALNAWAAHVEAIMKGQGAPGNVVTLRAKGA